MEYRLPIPQSMINYCDEYISWIKNGAKLPGSEGDSSSVRFSLSVDYDIMDEIAEKMRKRDMSFSELLKKYIEDEHLTNSTVYTKAQIDKSTFSKIINDENYTITKDTAICLSLAFILSVKDTNELIGKAGYSLSRSILRDIIIEYCIANGIRDIVTINGLLDHYKQRLLGRDK